MAKPTPRRTAKKSTKSARPVRKVKAKAKPVSEEAEAPDNVTPIKKLTKQERLKEITRQKKELADQQKELREELNATKGERKALRKAQIESRKKIKECKSTLRELTSAIYNVVNGHDWSEMDALADEITEAASSLAIAIRNHPTETDDDDVSGNSDDVSDDDFEEEEEEEEEEDL